MGDRINYSLPSGFDIEFLPGEKRLEQKFMEVMQNVFEKYGFTPLETPAVERLEVLQAKGNQGDNILYAIAPITLEFQEKEESRALKFDQTVPLAAYIALMHFRIDVRRPLENNFHFWQCGNAGNILAIIGAKDF